MNTGLRILTRSLFAAAGLAVCVAVAQAGQTPPAPRTAQQPASAGEAAASVQAPTEAALGIPVYPTAQYLGSYDAGRGQRFELFGAMATFPEIVAYYRTILRQRGDVVFEQPATHMFEVGRVRQDSVAFPPGVTVKDYTWGGSAGYPFAKPDGSVVRYPTVIQIVAVPPEAR
jgi:hypothetical protein